MRVSARREAEVTVSLVTFGWLALVRERSNEYIFQSVAGITLVVLLPSDRLPDSPATPIILLLWFRILRQVPGSHREGEVCLHALSKKVR
jgi:hypothetical protein